MTDLVHINAFLYPLDAKKGLASIYLVALQKNKNCLSLTVLLDMKPNQPIVCRKCKFYFITWDPQRPHGCKAMNFKSRRPPHLVVRQTSGKECMNFIPRKDVNDDGTR
jgi:hypothetical protein